MLCYGNNAKKVNYRNVVRVHSELGDLYLRSAVVDVIVIIVVGDFHIHQGLIMAGGVVQVVVVQQRTLDDGGTFKEARNAGKESSISLTKMPLVFLARRNGPIAAALMVLPFMPKVKLGTPAE